MTFDSLNIVTRSLPKIGWSLSSAMMVRLSFGSCRPWARMCSHSFDTTVVRARGSGPTTAARAGDGVSGFPRAPAVRGFERATMRDMGRLLRIGDVPTLSRYHVVA